MSQGHQKVALARSHLGKPVGAGDDGQDESCGNGESSSSSIAAEHQLVGAGPCGGCRGARRALGVRGRVGATARRRHAEAGAAT